MSVVRIMLQTSELRREVFGAKDTDIIKANLHRYLVLPPMSVTKVDDRDTSDPLDIAEEMFDLTNNPWRQRERMERYGNGQSLSTGDVIEVDGRKFACMFTGWKEIY